MDATKKRSASLAWVPPHADHAELVRAVQACRGCDLYARATQAVFGEGATSAQAILGGWFRVTKDRGRVRTATFGEANELSLRVLATWHPSAILRADDESGARARMRDELTADLATAWAAARGGGAARSHGRERRARAGAP